MNNLKFQSKTEINEILNNKSNDNINDENKDFNE